MADVLGKYSFLNTPDVNGVDVLLDGAAVSTLNGTANQIAVTGTNPTLTLGIAANPVIPGNASLTLPIGTTAQRPDTPVGGMVRYNTTLGSTEYYNGTTWIPAGSIVQTITGDIPSATSNSQIPYDNTLPQSGEGFQLWDRIFTPILSNSLIVITTSGFYTVSNASDIYATLATFNGTTCFSAALVGFTTNLGEGRGFSIISTQVSGSTAARTYSARMGPNINQALFYNRNAAGQLYGGSANIGQYIIQEIAP